MNEKKQWNNHPLIKSIARTASLDSSFRGAIGELDADWFSAEKLVTEKTAQEAALAHQAAKHPCMDARTQGAFFIGEWSWYMPAIAVGMYLLEQRVPDLSPENVAGRYGSFRWEEAGESGESEMIELRFLTGRFAVLPDDPAANHPDAIVLPNKTALREWLRERVEAHISPLIDGVYAQTRLARSAQWSLVADSCAALFLYLGQVLGIEEEAKAEGLAFVKATGSPMKNPKTGFISLEYMGHRDTYRERGGCCRYYMLPDSDKCTSCVLRSEEDRNERLLAFMARKYTQELVS